MLVNGLYRLFSWLMRLIRPVPDVLFSAELIDGGRRNPSIFLQVRWNDYRAGRQEFWIRIRERKRTRPRFSLHQSVAGPRGEALFSIGEEIPWALDLEVELLDRDPGEGLDAAEEDGAPLREHPVVEVVVRSRSRVLLLPDRRAEGVAYVHS